MIMTKLQTHLSTTTTTTVFRHLRSLHLGPDTIDELLDRHLSKTKKPILNDDETDLITRQCLLTSKREALSLYRDIIRATRFFTWLDSRGVLWRDVLRENARKEFEDARFEKDPEVITRLLIGGRDAVHSAIEKLVEKQKEVVRRRGMSLIGRGDDFVDAHQNDDRATEVSDSHHV